MRLRKFNTSSVFIGHRSDGKVRARPKGAGVGKYGDALKTLIPFRPKPK